MNIARRFEFCGSASGPDISPVGFDARLSQVSVAILKILHTDSAFQKRLSGATVCGPPQALSGVPLGVLPRQNKSKKDALQ